MALKIIFLGAVAGGVTKLVELFFRRRSAKASSTIAAAISRRRRKTNDCGVFDISLPHKVLNLDGVQVFSPVMITSFAVDK